MREDFPEVEVGDRLTADHVKKLTAVARRVSKGMAGSNLAGVDGHPAAMPPLVQKVVTLTSFDSEDGLKARPVHWDAELSEWIINDDDNEYPVTSESLMTVWWNPQRQAYVTIGQRRNAILLEAMDDGNTPVSIELVEMSIDEAGAVTWVGSGEMGKMVSYLSVGLSALSGSTKVKVDPTGWMINGVPLYELAGASC